MVNKGNGKFVSKTKLSIDELDDVAQEVFNSVNNRVHDVLTNKLREKGVDEEAIVGAIHGEVMSEFADTLKEELVTKVAKTQERYPGRRNNRNLSEFSQDINEAIDEIDAGNDDKAQKSISSIIMYLEEDGYGIRNESDVLLGLKSARDSVHEGAMAFIPISKLRNAKKKAKGG